LWSLGGAAAFIGVALGRRPHRGDAPLLAALISTQLTRTEIALIAVVWTLPFGLCILLQTQGLPLVLVACFAWLAGEAPGWSPIRLQRPPQAAPAKA
jgi:hypothetical protein